MSDTIVYLGCFHERGGYSESARMYIKTMIDARINVEPVAMYKNVRWNHNEIAKTVNEITKNNYTLVVHKHPTLPKGEDIAVQIINKLAIKARHKIFSTVWECDRVPPSWIDAFSSYDAVWVPSSGSKRAIEKTYQDNNEEIPFNIYVIPHIIDVKYEKQDIKVLDPTKFNFLAVISQISGRKGLDSLIKAYLGEFRKNENVMLTIKINGGPGNIGVNTIKNIISSIKRMFANQTIQPNISVIPDLMPKNDLYNLMTQADCIISPSRGEGFNMVVAEALKLNIPVIVSNWNYGMDYLDTFTKQPSKFVKFIDGMKENVIDQTYVGYGYDTSHMKWFEPNVGSLMEQMRDMFNEGKAYMKTDEYKEFSKRVSDIIMLQDQYILDKISNMIADIDNKKKNVSKSTKLSIMEI